MKIELFLLICEGNSSLSRKIKWFNHRMGYDNDYTHVALKVTLIYTGGDTVDYVFESTTLNKWAKKRGVQINYYADWFRNYNGKVYERVLGTDLSESQAWSFITTMRKMIGTDYESGIPGYIELILSFFDLGLKRLGTKELHCTESVVKILQLFDIMDSTLRPAKAPPAYWGNGGKIEKYFKVALGRKVGI